MLCVLPVPSRSQITPWIDIWGDTAQLDNHFESGFAQGRKPSLLARTTTRMGIRIPGSHPSTVLMPYLVATGNYSVDRNNWNNIYATGYGIRIFPFLTMQVSDSRLAFLPDTRLYWEQLFANYFKDRDNAKDRDTALANPSRDDRIGVEIWHEWNERDPAQPNKPFDKTDSWTELWADISYRETNFTSPPLRNTITSFQLRRGFYVNAPVGIIEPYGVINGVNSGATDFFLNNLQFGMGMRYHPFRYATNVQGLTALAAKARIFVEILTISYTKNRPAAGTPTTDFRFGVELAIGR